MSLDIRPTTLRRRCAGCGQEYLHAPVTAAGKHNGEHTHVIACSWVCLEAMVSELAETGGRDVRDADLVGGGERQVATA